MTVSKRVIGLVVIAVAVGIGATALAVSADSESPEPVTVWADGELVTHDDLAAALEEASEKAGFEVVAPSSHPEGLEVRAILVHQGPELPAGAPKSEFGLATLQLEVGSSRALLDQLRGQFRPTVADELLPNTVPNAEVYYNETDAAVIYSMLTRGRGFILNSALEQAMDRETALEVLSAFAAELN